jgi:hypothetical protein
MRLPSLSNSARPKGETMSDSAPPPPPPSEPDGPSPGSSSMSGDDVKAAFQSAHKYDLALIGVAVLAFIVSMFPFYKGSVETSGSIPDLNTAIGGSTSGDWSAWHGFFGWFAALLALIAAGLLIASLLKVTLPIPLRLTVLGLFGASLLCTLLAFFVSPLPGDESKQTFGGVTVEYSKGVAWGYWLFLVLVIAGTALAFLRKDATD